MKNGNAPKQRSGQTLNALPVPLFASVMGITGLGLAWRSFDDVFAIGYAVGNILVYAGAAVFIILAIAYALKALRHAAAVAAEYRNFAQTGFFTAIPIGVLLISGGWAERWPGVAGVMFWLSSVTMLILAALMTARLFRERPDLEAVNGGWFIGMASPILIPLAGLDMGYDGMSHVGLSVGFTMWVVLFPIVLGRTIFGSPTPPGLRPSWFILMVPPLVIFLGYMEITGGSLDFFSRSLFILGVFLTVALCYASRDIVRWPFTVAWWGFTFPLDALAAAATTYYRAEPSAMTELLAKFSMGLATLTVAVVAVLTLRALFAGTLYGAPPAKATP